ncbi:MAG: hypothetical protein IKR92_00200 [Alphaproteobacteria bacterium]|nr:hypothetical protein [Alphaproteobacteria bacterium]
MAKEQTVKHTHKIKLFGFLPLYGWTHRGGRKTWKVLGLPIYGRVHDQAKGVSKYYILGILMLKVSKKKV